MHFHKTVLRKTTKPYAPCALELDGQKVLVVAPVDNGEAFAFFPPHTGGGQAMWPDSGTMNIVPVPGAKNTFLSTRSFFTGFNAAESWVSLVHYTPGAETAWPSRRVLTLPYLHRFNVLRLDGRLVFIGCTLCQVKKSTDDWSSPGFVCAADITDNLEGEWKPRPVLEGIHKNHGYCHARWNGLPASFVTGQEGVYVIAMPSPDPAQWRVEKLMDQETSDIAVYDIDNDGRDEFLTIEGFHGDNICVYRKTGGGYEKIHHFVAPQGHVVWGGELAGERVFLVGHCSGASELLLLRPKAGGFVTERIDGNVGPRNIAVYRDGGDDCILAANSIAGEIAVYRVTRG